MPPHLRLKSKIHEAIYKCHIECVFGRESALLARNLPMKTFRPPSLSNLQVVAPEAFDECSSSLQVTGHQVRKSDPSMPQSENVLFRADSPAQSNPVFRLPASSTRHLQ
jgi:hypothetical protein